MTALIARVSPALKQKVKAYCESTQCTESELIKTAVAKLLSAEDAEVMKRLKKSRAEKITIRFTPEENTLIEQQAEGSGFAYRTDWIVSIVRKALGLPALNDSAILALRDSNRELLAMGRNLNQIAKVLNTDFRYANAASPELILALSNTISNHTEVVSEVLNAALNREVNT